ncbi:unnamed protein product [Closterium sp. Naga37s-1]|nr:unnamed protein product [Closterium sp. Naga37s-1]
MMTRGAGGAGGAGGADGAGGAGGAGGTGGVIIRIGIERTAGFGSDPIDLLPPPRDCIRMLKADVAARVIVKSSRAAGGKRVLTAGGECIVLATDKAARLVKHVKRRGK